MVHLRHGFWKICVCLVAWLSRDARVCCGGGQEVDGCPGVGCGLRDSGAARLAFGFESRQDKVGAPGRASCP